MNKRHRWMVVLSVLGTAVSAILALWLNSRPAPLELSLQSATNQPIDQRPHRLRRTAANSFPNDVRVEANELPNGPSEPELAGTWTTVYAPRARMGQFRVTRVSSFNFGPRLERWQCIDTPVGNATDVVQPDAPFSPFHLTAPPPPVPLDLLDGLPRY